MLRSFYLIRRHQLFIKRLGKEEHHFLFIYCKINIFLKKSINLIMIFFSVILYFHLVIVEFINKTTSVSNKNLFIFLHFTPILFDNPSTLVRPLFDKTPLFPNRCRRTLEQHSNKPYFYFYHFCLKPALIKESCVFCLFSFLLHTGQKWTIAVINGLY